MALEEKLNYLLTATWMQDGITPLHEAAREGSAHIAVELYRKRPERINAQDKVRSSLSSQPKYYGKIYFLSLCVCISTVWKYTFAFSGTWRAPRLGTPYDISLFEWHPDS